VEVRAAKAVKAAAVETEVVEAKAAEAEGCIGGGGMHWKRRNASEEHGSGRS
jgi:iron only hydrogenase large subunit-like protein